MSRKSILTIVVVFLFFLGGGIYFARLRQPGVQPRVGPSFSPLSSSIPDWEIYKNPNFGYSILYPSELKPREQGKVSERILDVISFVGVSERNLVPLLQIKVSSETFEEETKKRGLEIKTGGFATEAGRGAKIIISSIEGIKTTTETSEGKKVISVFLPFLDKTIIFVGTPQAISGKDYTETINQMISTFNPLKS